MAYITRDDGVHFVIPSYRDVLAAKNKTQLKKDILLLSQSYGEYITLQKKGLGQYEVAFSVDPGYLLGESVWHYLKRPLDLIYCEAIPGTSEALLVIVKSGSVYLDGSFPLDSIPEELVIFLTQQNNFEIYIYGDVPISETPEEGKFNFEANSVKSFNVLTDPIYPSLPLLKTYQLQLVAQVLRSQGIGVFPLKQLLALTAGIAVLWLVYYYLTSEAPEEKKVATVDPYQGYYNALTSAAPDTEFKSILTAIIQFYSIPGWYPTQVDYAPRTITATVLSAGGSMENLLKWADLHHMKSEVTPTGIILTTNITTPPRPAPTKIFSLKTVIAQFIDRLAMIYPGNHLQINEIINKGSYVDMRFTINIADDLSPGVVALIADQVKGLPFVLQKATFTTTNGNIMGTIIFEALGSQT